MGALTAGPLSNFIATRAARRNNGISEAEMRLPTLIPYFCTTVSRIVVEGLALQRKWTWPVLVIIGFACAGLTVTAIPTILVSYAVDCYKLIADEIMVVATALKNVCGVGMSYWVPKLAESHGLLLPAMVQFPLASAPLLIGSMMYLKGKRLRNATRNS